MTVMHKYTYTLLRYIHDTATGEFVNVGVAVHCPEEKFVGAKCRKTYGRIARTFPGIDGDAFKASMRFIERRFDEQATSLRKELPLDGKESVIEFARSVVPADASSLQWSPIKGGITNNAEAMLEHLYERMVSRYDEKQQHERRGDEEVWRSFKRELEALRLAEFFQPKTILSKDDEVQFEHAWKNGVWHCLAPVSFDLSSQDSIRDKAYRWLGQMTSIKDANEKFKIYMILGLPQQQELINAYNSAVGILSKMPVEAEFYTEADAATLTARLQAEVREHMESAEHEE